LVIFWICSVPIASPVLLVHQALREIARVLADIRAVAACPTRDLLCASLPLNLGIGSLNGRSVFGGSLKNKGGLAPNGKSSCTGIKAG
jgi:hypothetical protein